MKIAICQHLSASYWGGGEKEMWGLAQGLSGFGHEVEVLALPYTLENKRKVDASFLYQDGIRYHESPLHLVNADVVYSMYHPFSRFSFITRAPTIASFHSQIWFNTNRSGYGYVPRAAAWLGDRLLRQEINDFDAVHVHSPSEAKGIRVRTNRHPPVYVIEHFVDSTVFHPARKRDEFTVLYVGRSVWQKGFDLFEKLAVRLHARGIKFECVGGSSNCDYVDSLGFAIDEGRLSTIMAQSHLVVAPSRIESMPGKSVLEALACGTPVVLSSKVEAPLQDCRSLMQAAQFSEMQESVVYTYEAWRRGSYDEIASCARPCVISNYSYDKTILKYERMLRDVAATQGAHFRWNEGNQSTR